MKNQKNIWSFVLIIVCPVFAQQNLAQISPHSSVIQKIKILTFLSFLLTLSGVKAQSIINVNSIKYGCVNRVDTIINGRVIYSFTKTGSGILFFDRVTPPAGDTLYKFDVYKNDTLPSSLLYTKNRSSLSDSLALSYRIHDSLPNGQYVIKLYFKTRNGNVASTLCLYELQIPACATTGCQTMANTNFATTLTNPGFSPFDIGGVPCWMCAWGSPQITANANPNLNYAMMWHGAASTPSSTQQSGEGITQYLANPLSPSKTYALVVEAKQYPGTSIAVDNFIVSLTHTATSNVPPASGIASIPSFPAQQILNSNQINNTSSWKTLGGCFTPNQNYDQVVVYPRQNPGNNVSGWVAIKSIGMYDLTPKHTVLTVNCHDNVTLGSAACVIPNAQYSWAPSTGLSNPNTMNPTATPISNITYTLTVTIPYTGGSSCSFQDTYAINVLPTPKPTISGGHTICPAVSTTLTASGAATYTWQPINSTGATAIVSPTVTTTYTVYSETAPGCLSSNTVILTVFNVPTLTVTASPNVTTCPGANTAIFATGGGSGYTWYPGGTLASSIIATPTAPVIYTVTSVTSDGCPQRGTVLINPISCCTLTSAVLFTATSGTITGGTYVLNSPLTLTNHLVLQGVTIFMGTNAEIIVPNGLVLGMFTTHLLGCPQMWKGIRCTGSSASIVAVKNTMIEDAITAVDLANVSTPVYQGNILFLENMTFNKNYTAVNIENYNTTASHYPAYIADVTFTSRKLITADHLLVNPALTVTYNWPIATNINSLKGIPTFPATINPDVDLQTSYVFSIASYSTSNCEVPYSNSLSHQGLRVKNVYSASNYNGLVLQSYNASGTGTDFHWHNLYDNMHYGVNGENANIYSCNAIYQNMSQYVSGTDPADPKFKLYNGGVGINNVSTMSSGLTGSQTFSMAVGPYIPGKINMTTNLFINNAYGIKTDNIQYVTAAFNIFHSSRAYNPNGPFSFNGPVDKGQYAIYMKSFDYRNLYIVRNFMANVNNGIVFIADANRILNKFYVQYPGAVSIQNNTIKANYGNTVANQSLTQGIAVDNLLSPLALTISSGTASPVKVTDNIIDKAFNGITASNWNKQRIMTNSNTITLANDGGNANQYGIRHSNNLGDNIVANTITGFNTTKVRVHGILATENKSQTLTCNTTENMYYGVVFKGSQNLTTWQSNTMKSHKQAMLLDNTSIGQQGSAGHPIANLWLGTWTGAYKLYVNGMDPGTPAGNSQLYLSNLPTSAESDAFPFPTLKFKTTPPKSLFHTTGLSDKDCPYTTSLPHALAFMKVIANLDNLVRDSFMYATNVNGKRKNGKFAVYRAVSEDPTLLATDTILQNFKTASDAGNIGKFFALEQYMAEGNLASADAVLSSISPVDTVEYVLKRFYQVYQNLNIASYSAADEADLVMIAKGCPDQFGVGVYQTRALLNSIYDVYYSYESDCGDASSVAYRRGGNEEPGNDAPVEHSFMVYPNPSTGTVYFTTRNLGVENYLVTVYDISGKAIFIKDYTDGEAVNALELHLSNGVYLMQLTDKDKGDVYKQKFIIQK